MVLPIYCIVAPFAAAFCSLPDASSMPARTAFVQARPLHLLGMVAFTVQSRHSQNRANALSAALQLFLLITWRSVHASAHAAFVQARPLPFAWHGCFYSSVAPFAESCLTHSAALQLFLLITWRSVHACAHAAFVQARPLHLLGMVALQFSRAIRRIVLTHSPLRCSYFCFITWRSVQPPARARSFSCKHDCCICWA